MSLSPALNIPTGGMDAGSRKSTGLSFGAIKILEQQKKNFVQKSESSQNLSEEASKISGGDEFLLASLVESGFITGSIKTVFERGKQAIFQQSLEQFIEKQKKIIQTLCSDHYEEFLKSVVQLKTVRSEAKLLREKIVDVNDDIQSAGRVALEKGKQLLRSRLVGDNISQCLQTLEKCRFVASLSTKISNLVEQQKFYPALIILEQLEKELQNPFFKDFKFAEFLQRHIPKQRNMIKSRVETGFNEWLSLCKKQSQELGKTMIQMTEKRMLLVKQKQNASINEEDAAQDAVMPLLKHDLLLFTNYEEENVFNVVNIDFSPVYTCKHIFETLDCVDEFKSYYRHNREIQIKAELKNPPLSFTPEQNNNHGNNTFDSNVETKSTIQQFEEWLCRILGYFTVESAILHSTSSLLSNVEVNILWESTCQQICICLKELLFQQEEYYIQRNMQDSHIDDSYAFFCLKMKNILIKFCFTVQQKLSLHAAPILEILEEQKEKFVISLQSAVQKHVFQYINAEKYIPLDIHSSQHYQTLQNYFLLSDSDQKEVTQVPFSPTVVELVELISFQFIAPCFSYSQYLSPIDELIRLGLIDILNYVNECMEKSLKYSQNQSLTQFSQLAINAEYLAKACRYLEYEYFNKESGSSQTVKKRSHIGQLVILKGPQDLFMQTKARSEDLMLRSITNKVDDQMSLLPCTNWIQKVPEQESAITPHDCISMLVTFLESTEFSLKHLTKEKREYFTFKASQHIATQITNIVVHQSSIKELNIDSVKILKKDIQLIESFIDKLGFSKCKFCFNELETLFDFLLKQASSKGSHYVERIAQNPDEYQQFCATFDDAVKSEEQSKCLRSILQKLSQRHQPNKADDHPTNSRKSNGTTSTNTPPQTSTPPNKKPPSQKKPVKKKFFGLF